jgi:hypothetical protein
MMEYIAGLHVHMLQADIEKLPLDGTATLIDPDSSSSSSSENQVPQYKMNHLQVLLRQVKANVNVHWDLEPGFQQQMERILKKVPPARTELTFLYVTESLEDVLSKFKYVEKSGSASSNHSVAGSNSSGQISSLFSSIAKQFSNSLNDGSGASGSNGSNGSGSSSSTSNSSMAAKVKHHPMGGLIADLFPNPEGYIFIGFSTQQTTGTGYHLAAQVSYQINSSPPLERKTAFLIDFCFL